MLRFLILLLIIYSCNPHYNQDMNQPGSPSAKELKYKLGDCLSFKAGDTSYGCVVVCDFSKDEAGIWYGVFYSNYNGTVRPTTSDIKNGKVMGRKVHSSSNEQGFIKGLDGDFLNESLFSDAGNFTFIGNVQLKDKIYLASEGAIDSMSFLRMEFADKIKIRLKAPDHYTEHLTKINDFHPEEYFMASEFVE